MKIHTFILVFYTLIFCSEKLFAQVDLAADQVQFVTTTTKIFLADYPDAHNPSLIDTDKGLLLTFRWLPNPLTPWISYIGVVYLDESFQPISTPQLLDTRIGNRTIPSQSEDARIFYYQGNLYVIYNDNPTYINPSLLQRRDMYIAQLIDVEGKLVLAEPVKLYHQQKYFTQKWQKNWVPFEWHGALLLSYSLIPHEVLYTDLISGECIPFVASPFAHPKWKWEWGILRGGTSATLIDKDEEQNKEYLAFFHSSIITSSEASNGVFMHHYYMGAYTFSDEPPFEITKVTLSPIVVDGFYTKSSLSKRVIFPGGFVTRDKHFYLAYGKDDLEIWIATIDRQEFIKALVPVSQLK